MRAAGGGWFGKIVRRQPASRRTSCVRDDTVPFQAKQSFDGKGGPLGSVAWSVPRTQMLEPSVEELAL